MYRIQAFGIFFFLWCFVAQAQFVFQNLKEEDGVSAKVVRCIYKDQEGFVWIGTANGLNRYDGDIVKQYTDTRRAQNIQINAIQPIDGQAKLLLATADGIRVFNKSLGNFESDSRFQKLAHIPINSIKRDHLSRLWLLARSQIYIYDGYKLAELGKLMPWARSIVSNNLSYAPRHAFQWDERRKGFWVGGYQCFFVDCENELVYDRSHNPYNWAFLRQQLVKAIALDKNDNIWYSTFQDSSLHYSDLKTNSDTSYLHLDGKRATDGINALFVDSQQRLWISTWMYAAYIKDPGRAIRKVPYSQDAPYSIAYGFFEDMLEDTEGDLWFATINGVSHLSSNSPFRSIYKLPSFKSYFETDFVHTNSLSKSGDTIFAAKEDGLIEFNTATGRYTRHAFSDVMLARNKFNNSVKIGNTWWLASSEGLYYLKPGNKKVSRLAGIKNERKSTHCNFVLKDGQNNIWFNIVGDAIYKLDTKTRLLLRHDGTDPSYGLFRYVVCKNAYKLASGDVIFAMSGQGFIRFSQKNGQFSTIPVKEAANFDVTGIVEDKSGFLWVAILDRGLYKMNLMGEVLDSLDTKNSFLVKRINGLAIDSRGAIWAASAGGLLYFFPNSKKITYVQINLGKTLQNYWNCVIATRDYVYAAMLDHIVVIDPTKFARIPVKKPPHVTSVKVFGKEVSDFLPASFVLPPEKDFITFQYASVKHRDIPSLQYSYQLTGIDKNWVNAGRNMSVSYNSLAPGDYVFKVRSTDEHERWMQKITTVNIKILPFWYQSWWFFVLVGCVSGLFSFLTYHGYINRKQKRGFTRAIEYFANSVYGENSVNEICLDIARNCCSELRFEDCTVFLWDNDKKKLVQKATYGMKNPGEFEIVDPLELSLGEGIVGVAAETKKVVNISDTSRDPRYIALNVEKRSEIAVPILHEGKLIGVLDSEHTKKNFFTEDHSRTLVTIACINANKIAEAQAEGEAAKKEIMLLEINRMLAESQLMALRAQMNPHFVFNCLNSIQECIVTQKYGEASKYLNKFSKLFRMVLNNSDRNLVTIEEEKGVLELYLELEQMRFEQSFVYRIDIDEDLEADDILLPSMLLQPYVENAIWHGLMHKDGHRELKISFERIDEEIFQCTIEDNGIGRKKSMEIRERNATTRRHKSKGLQIAEDRLTLIDRQGQHASVEIVDKYDAEEVAVGTMIIIELSTTLENT